MPPDDVVGATVMELFGAVTTFTDDSMLAMIRRSLCAAETRDVFSWIVWPVQDRTNFRLLTPSTPLPDRSPCSGQTCSFRRQEASHLRSG